MFHLDLLCLWLALLNINWPDGKSTSSIQSWKFFQIIVFQITFDLLLLYANEKVCPTQNICVLLMFLAYSQMHLLIELLVYVQMYFITALKN